ncbi:Ribosomal RNA small subunit methyltransferase D [Gammaproteobacteria bacterium]|uniref:16S rRNA (guanine(966)-N(2))-methyltransferase RsmD n=1 Tax=Dokdonella sp. TaxID=2291710 RepID=UPI001AD3A75B|nr:16S rRNA (guanine(966)-N(2))-methyltransferase RsmD [Dokdonella sp.]CAG0981488.1 Ribosomal RNA small subunit methyltransferase D [Gammaproteobacteria bacterium]
MSKPNSRSSSVRIVGGLLRGSRLAVADRDGLRPTPDRVRETLFNWLAPVISGARCLDLFAGTGALGIEALSRGAAVCTFIERDRALAQGLRDNLARLHVQGGEVVEADAVGWLARPATPVDIAFLDPPFAAGLWGSAAQALDRGGWLRAGALVYVESDARGVPPLPAAWTLHREGHAGAVRFALYRRE